jgi:hypothetical protein
MELYIFLHSYTFNILIIIFNLKNLLKHQILFKRHFQIHKQNNIFKNIYSMSNISCYTY